MKEANINNTSNTNDSNDNHDSENSEITKREHELALIGLLSSSVVHEIKTPIMLAQEYISLLKENLKWPVSETLFKEQITIADKLEKNLNNIVEIVNNMQDLVRNNTGELSDCDIEMVILDAIAICTKKIEKNNIDFQFENSIGPQSILGRPSQLSQVIINLINNAVDAIVQDQNEKKRFLKIAINKSQMQIKSSNQNDYKIVISIENSGNIPQDIRKKIFQPLFSTKKSSKKGTGLGLYLAKEILKLHNGILTLDDTSPNTKFLITIPPYSPN